MLTITAEDFAILFHSREGGLTVTRLMVYDGDEASGSNSCDMTS
jgi:hypothetical protein